MATTVEAEDKVLATAQRIVQSLTNTSDADDMFMIFSSFDNRLSALSSFVDHGNSSTGQIGDRNSSSVRSTGNNSNVSPSASPPHLPPVATAPTQSPLDPIFDAAEEIILNESDLSSVPDEYYAAVDDVIHLMDELDLNELPPEAAERVDNVVQLAMTRFEDEFRHILIRSTIPLDQDRLHRSSLSSSAAAIAIAATEFLNGEEGSESIEEVSSARYGGSGRKRGVSFGGDELAIELIHPEAVDELKGIADRMIKTGYEKECCQVYCSVRRDVLDECMSILGAEKLSIEDVQRIDWRELDDKMRKWVYAVKILVRGLLPSEKHLCEQVFTESELIKEVCFLETSKGCVMQLLNFGEAVAIGRRSAEKLFRILDMYDVLAQVLPDLQGLFMDEDAGDMVCNEAKGVLEALGEAAIGTFIEFENAVKGESSKKPVQNGDLHPLTRYVMNYVKLLVDYSDTLNLLLENVETVSDEVVGIPNYVADAESMSLIAKRLLALITSLESNLEDKSKVYEDSAMQYIFLMNNVQYVVKKVKDSELRKLLGDNWVKKRRGLVRQYATHYLRASWTKALACLKDDGIGSSSSSNASKMALKERFKKFNACFEEIYRVQTGWKVPDPQLREELRISISEKVIPAYRSFLGRFGNQIEGGRHAGKYIKYTPEDLEDYLLNLFEGNPQILHHNLRRKST